MTTRQRKLFFAFCIEETLKNKRKPWHFSGRQAFIDFVLTGVEASGTGCDVQENLPTPGAADWADGSNDLILQQCMKVKIGNAQWGAAKK